MIDIPNVVSGLDKGKSICGKCTSSPDKLVLKKEYFMEGHEIAREKGMNDYVYVVGELKEKLLKGKFKRLWTPTTNEYWERRNKFWKLAIG